MTDAIISIKPQHVTNILSGEKTVELRTRNIKLPTGSKLWVYSTLPEGKIKASVRIAFIESLSPQSMWIKYGSKICITKKEFNNYTKGRSQVTAIGLTNTKKLKNELSLDAIRKYDSSFQPPQFFSKIPPDRKIYPELQKSE